ncbi:hypothetical protein GKE82_07495 [Conexibacter sp. W3-3-2]|uniref:hypothetical protein n=1 Tax=Conexibacter sp. W3-3-2 TaxID=2675227 RepID=UPI0012B79341|nr:hypothetical protein [Conexibacter sp. W3-3-2]MTD44147.1 hypothetical protein [Conexibacter sp. W3-3-2]
MRKGAMLATMLAVGLGAGTSPADAKVKLKVTPKTPIVDDAITVSFKTDRTLKKGYHYSVALIGRSGSNCSSFVVKDSQRKPKKGKSMSFSLSPFDDKLAEAPEWCQGKASITVSIDKDGTNKGNIVGITEIRFVAKP